MAEKVKILTTSNWHPYEHALEDDYNEWIETMGGKIEIIDRQYRLAAATDVVGASCYVQSIAVFYTEKDGK